MMLWSFLQTPDVSVRLQVNGPVIGERDIPQFNFIKSAVTTLIQENLVEPRRACISWDVGQVGAQEVRYTYSAETLAALRKLMGPV